MAFPMDQWTRDQAKTWLKRNGYKLGELDVTRNFYRFRQTDPAKYSSFGVVHRTSAGRPLQLVIGGQR